VQLEKDILEKLGDSNPDTILDTDELIDILDVSKVKSTKIKQSI
jgi:hypothetical protein